MADKKILITGGSSGLGAAVVEASVNQGWSPMVVDMKPPIFDIAHEIVDVSNTRETEAAVRRLAGQVDGFDAIVTAAGLDRCGNFWEVSGEDWEYVVKVNLLGTVAAVRAAYPSLESSHGKVVTVASTLGLRVVPGASAYCASKFGVVGFTRALALETQGKIGVTLLIPAGMSTSFFDDREESYKPSADTVLNKPQDVASAIVFILQQPAPCEIRELLIAPSVESSWP